MRQKSSEKEIKINYLRTNVAKKYANLSFKALLTRIKNNEEAFKIQNYKTEYTYIQDIRTNEEFIILENPILIRNLIAERISGNNK